MPFAHKRQSHPVPVGQSLSVLSGLRGELFRPTSLCCAEDLLPAFFCEDPDFPKNPALAANPFALSDLVRGPNQAALPEKPDRPTSFPSMPSYDPC